MRSTAYPPRSFSTAKLGRLLHDAEANGTTFLMIAALANVSPATITRIAEGTHEPKLHTAVAICEAMGWSVKLVRSPETEVVSQHE